MMNGSTSKIHSENPPNSQPKGAKSRIHDYTQGIPRKINNVCLASLLAGFAERKRLIDDYADRVVIEQEFAF